MTGAEGFEWDEGNADKNLAKHGVSNAEIEELFFNMPLFIKDDPEHSSTSENRRFALGQTFDGRRLAIVFTMRRNRIRPISARDMSRKEREVYEKIKEDSGF